MLINVIGLGYIGLPTSLILGYNGFKVVGSDLNSNLVKSLNSGVVTFEEKGLVELFNASKKNIMFQNEYCSDADVYIVAVPTPYDKASKKIDSRYVVTAVEHIVTKCKKGAIIIIESTVSPGTIEKNIFPIIERAGYEVDKDIFVAHAPERIIPGNMIYELKTNSRTIGCNNKEAGLFVCDIYKQLTSGKVVLTSIKIAEMTKVVENTYRAVNIALANELAQICDSDNMDVREIISICNLHPRVNILNPGPGVGGHCISIDPWFLVGDYPELSKLIRQSMEINEFMPRYVKTKILNIMKENNVSSFSRVGVYGLTYKENVDDYRESPALQLYSHLNGEERNLLFFDPFVKNKIVSNQEQDFSSFLNQIDILVLLVKHDHILNHFPEIKNKIIFDTQNVLCNAKYKL